MAVLMGAVGVVALGGTAEASSPTLFKAVQCPDGYQLNPQNTQQCVPKSDPYGGGGQPAGG